MTFFNFALGTACVAGLGMMAYAVSGGAWMSTRLMDKSESTPPPTSAVFATVPADDLIATTERVDLTRTPFAANGNGTERVQARLEQARAMNARNHAMSPLASSGGSRRAAKSGTRIGSYRAAKASQVGRPAQRSTSAARRRALENRLPRRGMSSIRQRGYRNPRYIGRNLKRRTRNPRNGRNYYAR